MSIDPPQVAVKKASDAETQACSFADVLDSGETLATLTSVLEVTTTDLTLGNKAINTAELTILGETVAVGEAVQWSVSGGTAGTVYQIRIIVITSASVPRTLVRTCRLQIEAN